MTSFADIKAKAARRVRFYDACVDQSLAVQHDQLTADLQAAGKSPQESLADGAERQIAEQLVDLERAMAEAQDRFWIKALPQREFLEVVDTHPPRDGNARDAASGYDWSTFPAAIIAATSIDPPEGEHGVDKLTEEQAGELFHELLSAADAEGLLDAAMRDNVIPSKVPFSVLASATLRAAEQS